MKLNSIEKGVAVVALSLGTLMPVHAQQSDPALTAAVHRIGQNFSLGNITSSGHFASLLLIII